MNNIYRHGDIWLKSIDGIPEGAVKEETNVLVRGEHTGHAHTLVEDDTYELLIKDMKKYLKVYKPTQLNHQEHHTITIEPGIYRIDIEREIDPFEGKIREVRD